VLSSAPPPPPQGTGLPLIESLCSRSHWMKRFIASPTRLVTSSVLLNRFPPSPFPLEHHVLRCSLGCVPGNIPSEDPLVFYPGLSRFFFLLVPRDTLFLSAPDVMGASPLTVLKIMRRYGASLFRCFLSACRVFFTGEAPCPPRSPLPFLFSISGRRLRPPPLLIFSHPGPLFPLCRSWYQFS